MGEPVTERARSERTPVHSLEQGLEPLRAWFAREVDHVRVLGIVSSTCPMCVRGRRDGLEPLLGEPADFRMAWAFIDMLPTDTLDTAIDAAHSVHDSRLHAFHDSRQRLGTAMARTLGWTGHVAWDVYFVYPAGTRWTADDLPKPPFWFHQLKDREAWKQTATTEVGSEEWTECLSDRSEADPSHFATGEELRVAVADAVARAAIFGEAG